MAHVVAEELGGIPMSAALQSTLLRAREYAISQGHREVTLEHLLLSLSEDEDATGVLQACRLDLARLRNDISAYLGDLQDRAATPGAAPTIASSLTQILKYATLAAKQGRRPRIDGAIVLAAIVGDGKSMAAGFLKTQGLTFEEAVRVLQQTIRDGARPDARPAPPAAAAPPSPPPSPPPPPVTPAPAVAPRGASADDILAAARERLMSRVPNQSSSDAAAQPVAPPPTPLPASNDPTEPSTPINGAPAAPLAADPGLPKSPEPPAPPLAPPMATPPAAPAQINRSDEPAERAATPPPSPSSWAPPPLPMAPASAGQSPPRTGPAVNGHIRTAAPVPSGVRPPLPPLAPLPGVAWPAPPDTVAPPPTAPSPPPWSADRRQVPTPQPPRPAAPPSSPAPAPLDSRAHARYEQPHGAGSATRAPAIEASHLSHNIPARLTLGQTQQVEIQIRRSPLNGGGPNSRPSPDRRDVVTARAIAVRLRPSKGRFVIDQTSPETQWDKAIDGARLGGETAVWRLNVQPQTLGAGELLLTVTARTVTADGMIIETALPDQVFEVRARRDFRRTLGWFGTLALVAVASVAVLEFTELLLGFNPLRALRDFVWR